VRGIFQHDFCDEMVWRLQIYIFLHFHRIFLHDFWRKILLIFVQETLPGTPRAAPETSTSAQAISYVFGRAHTCSRPGPRSKIDLLTLEQGIATGPVNRATFQSTGPRASLLVLICVCVSRRQCLEMKTKRS
jgi:hypothetical protein